MIENYYNQNAIIFFNDTVNVDMNEFYKKFESYLLPSAKILDLGCGSGRDILYFKNKGYDVVGIDNSEELIKLSKKYLNIDIIKKDFRNLNFNNEFDGIWACASLLHLKRIEIKKVFESCLKALKKDGIFYSSYKYGDFEGFKNGRYFTFYNEVLIKKLISEFDNISLLELWKSRDRRKNRENEFWLNLIIKKNT